VPANREVNAALGRVPKPSPFHGLCGEVSCLSKALTGGQNVRGGVMRSVRIGKPGSRRAGRPAPPCSTCKDLLPQFGVKG
jgi:hypothetical protein